MAILRFLSFLVLSSAVGEGRESHAWNSRTIKPGAIAQICQFVKIRSSFEKIWLIKRFNVRNYESNNLQRGRQTCRINPIKPAFEIDI